ncbi:DNA-binding transcriptional regulator, XRE-family HTH domain [Chitinophaga costaii]|uniref:DNA-binding transcriptional regulator, XRE-family HTH domain n=1 Tax=Chitinophaga costaii TaxID=1335309 RepID=A0A1C4DB06_9BACT|nr:helix-turn-helix transcriptional regulator [Chitinophaga costaii]PUZ24543.1 XRE family transcriptional regulator [Chitinophaga costaii]SCC28565.1 DNA-binding transcriptional regulator, XRE-family HTH domain [Chitinophaga costaii]
MTTREATLKDKAYWLAQIQSQVHHLLEHYRIEHQLTKTQLAAKLGVSKGYITQILNGEFDHKVSKLVELALAFDKVPFFEYMDTNVYLDKVGDAFPDKAVIYHLQSQASLPHAADQPTPFNEDSDKDKNKKAE